MDYNETWIWKISSVLVCKLALWRRHHFRLRAVEVPSSLFFLASAMCVFYTFFFYFFNFWYFNYIFTHCLSLSWILSIVCNYFIHLQRNNAYFACAVLRPMVSLFVCLIEHWELAVAQFKHKTRRKRRAVMKKEEEKKKNRMERRDEKVLASEIGG